MVLVMKVASNAEPATLRGGHPQVGAASVEDDHEFLRRTAKANLPVVLQIVKTVYRFEVAASHARCRGEIYLGIEEVQNRNVFATIGRLQKPKLLCSLLGCQRICAQRALVERDLHYLILCTDRTYANSCQENGEEL